MADLGELKGKTIKGLFWSFSDLIFNQGIQFVIQIFLARLLLPEEFGLIGIITVFIAVSNSIIDSGFTNALIREENASQDDYSTVFYFNIAMSVIMYLTLFISAPLISKFFNEPMLVSILRILSLTLIINSFGLIQKTMLTKKINFRSQTAINIIASVSSGVIAIFLAYKGFGVWSLVIRTIIMQILQAVLLSLSNKWLPSFVFKVESFKRLFGFGWKMMVSGIIDTIYNNLYYLIIGRFFSTTQLGYYTNAQKLRDVASTSITTSVQKVSYPVLSNLQTEEDKLKSAYKKIIKNTVFVTFPVMVGLAVVAKPLITIVFGEKWIGSIFFFQLLAVDGMIFPLHVINLNILQVKGRSDLFLKLEVIKKVLSVAIIAIALIGGFGIEGLICAAIIDSYISYFINSHFSGKFVSYSTKDQIKDILPIFVASLLMGLVTYGVGIFISSNIIRLIVQIVVGIVSYIGISLVIKIEELKTIWELIFNYIKKFMNLKNKLTPEDIKNT